MIKVTHTVTLDGKTDTEYAAIVAYLEPLKDLFPAWQLIKEPLVNRVTAIKTEEVKSL